MRYAYPVVLWGSLSLMVALSRDFGVTWDEDVQQEYGQLVFRYFASAFDDQSALSFKNLYFYGGMFDLLCVLVQKVVPADPYVVRHVINSVFGWLGIVFCGKLASRLFGVRAGLLAMGLLALSPRYFGDSMNNPKDIPFAAMSAVVLYCLSKIQPHFPYLSRAGATRLAVALALAINARAGGILYLCYTAALIAVSMVRDKNLSPRNVWSAGWQLALISAAAIVLGTTFWPWAHMQPLLKPFEALREFAKFDASLFVLYRGQYVPADALPPDYPFYYLLITTPPVVLIGLVFGFAATIGSARERFWLISLWVAVLFPLMYVAIRGSTLYDGIRHLLFVYPPLVVLAAAGWMTLFRWTDGSSTRFVLAAVLIAGLLEPLVFQLRNHPNQIVYFNQFVGGPRGAFGRFELDYWGNSLLQAVEWTASAARHSSRVLNISAGTPDNVVKLDAHRYSAAVRFVNRDETPDHLRIQLLRHSPEQLAALIR
ncbi:MAG TPA: hypothetical protein VGJ22_05305, partial [Anaerolineales bacterium]